MKNENSGESILDFTPGTNNESSDNLQNEYFPILHGKATTAIARISGSEFDHIDYSGRGEIKENGVKVLIDQLDSSLGKMRISTHKLLSTAIIQFVSKNHISKKRKSYIRDTKVTIPLKKYAKQCGYDVEEHKTATKEDAEKEALRVKRTLDNFRRKIKKDLDILFSASISWHEKIDGREEDFIDVRIIGGKGIRGGYITIEFTNTMADYLTQLPMSQYPKTLLSLDERNNNAYNIGLKMAEHYSNDNNQIKGTAQLLRVKTLLACTKLPSIEEVKIKEKSWKERIRRPFESALKNLIDCEFIESWRYSGSKGEQLSKKTSNLHHTMIRQIL